LRFLAVFREDKMKSSPAILAVIALLLAAFSLGIQAQVPLPGPVLQQVQVPVARARFNGTAGDVFVRYILIDPGSADPVQDGFAPLERVAVLVLFIGGDGAMGFTAGQLNTGSPNFVARNRNHFAAEGFVVAVVDAANDFNNSPTGLRGRRLSTAHREDLRAVMANLRTRYPNLPIWGVGHSRGTLSAAVTAVAVDPPADGLVLISSLTGDPANPTEDLSSLDIESIRAPVLIVSHQGDLCAFTSPEDSRALRKRFIASERAKFRDFSGGSAPISNPCDPLSPHGFFGIDQKVVEAIAKWIRHRQDL
jgi:hypothetical protein